MGTLACTLISHNINTTGVSVVTLTNVTLYSLIPRRLWCIVSYDTCSSWSTSSFFHVDPCGVWWDSQRTAAHMFSPQIYCPLPCPRILLTMQTTLVSPGVWTDLVVLHANTVSPPPPTGHLLRSSSVSCTGEFRVCSLFNAVKVSAHWCASKIRDLPT